MWISQELNEVMKENNWSVKSYEDADFSEYVSLIESEYGSQSEIAQPQFLTWQYTDNPAGKVNLYLAMSPDNRIVGGCGYIPVRVIINGTPETAGLRINAITHKDFRGKKIFTSLAEITYQNGLRERDISLNYTFPNPKSYPAFIKYLKFKFIDVGPVPLLIRINKLGNLVSSRFKFTPGRMLNTAGKLAFNIKRLPRKPGGSTIDEIKEFDDRFTALWERNQDLFVNAVIRDSAYLNWRYTINPLRKYKIYAAFDSSGSVKGFIVCRIIEKEGIGSGLIGDFFTDRNDSNISDLLIRKAEEYFRSAETDMWGVLMFEHIPYYQHFKRNGFLKCPKRFEPQPFPVLVRSIKNDESVFDKRNWYFTMGDYDIF